jgi:TolB protein
MPRKVVFRILGNPEAIDPTLPNFHVAGHLPAGENKIEFTGWLRSIVPVDHLEVICNGNVVRDLKLNGNPQSADEKGTVSISQTGCVLRASSNKPEHPELDDYVYATTSPIYVREAGLVPKPMGDAAFFITWIDRLIETTKANGNWNTAAERVPVLRTLDAARQVYLCLQK